ncbi:MAG: BREX-3 system P-loop-containing protein BrxF [bacterium]|nr:BREX-3 system P-loop-containing protein BrxF [bacterium]
MILSFREQIIEKIEQAGALVHQLIIAAAPPGAGKTAAFREIHTRMNIPLLDVNLELSRLMLDLTQHQRTIQLPELLDGMVRETDGQRVLLDNIEILFDVSLKQDPLRLLQGLSRKKTVISAWSGTVEMDRHQQLEALIYATPGHPEYRRFNIGNTRVICPQKNN